MCSPSGRATVADGSPVGSERAGGSAEAGTSPSRTKDPISPEDLRALVQTQVVAASSNKQLTKGMACLLLYAGCLRASDLGQLEWQSIEFSPSGMHLFLASSKTDQHHKGRSVPVARTFDLFCPVALTEAFITAVGHRAAGPGPLTRVLGPTGMAASSDTAPSYITLRTWCREAMAAAGLDVSLLGTHSMRKGAATVIANAGVPTSVLQGIGGWACPSVLDRYVTHTDDTMFAASRTLGLAAPFLHRAELAVASGRRRRQRLSLDTAKSSS